MQASKQSLSVRSNVCLAKAYGGCVCIEMGLFSPRFVEFVSSVEEQGTCTCTGGWVGSVSVE